MSTHRKAWTTYIVLRLVFFVVPFGALYALGLALGLSMMLSGIIAAVLAALIGVSLSILLLSKPREEASESIYAWRNRDRTVDDVAEDAALDGEAAPQVSVSPGHDASVAPGRDAPVAPELSERD